MNSPPVIVQKICPHCGARSVSKDNTCWLCYQDASTPNPFAVTAGIPTEPIVEEASSIWDLVFSGLLGLCVLLTILIGVGLAIQDIGLLIPFAIFVGPAYLVTITRVMLQLGSGRKVRAGSLLLTLAVSGLITTALVIIFFVAALVILFIICINSLGP